ncbi:hypothetical protein Y717_23270 [Streptomyces scopuliridis RB72]|uniref:Uncharacterized protein n=1 Tax=Streptomyces scopuliridis RB72 TaxID=1440053 RepID=A0A2T7SXF2_9ACTN|nr:hypothetical protein Y717_23270 [Streptomyces scopuliridis RB72]
MSPVNDDVNFFVALAAGLRPVQAPLSARDGSIDPAGLPESGWHSSRPPVAPAPKGRYPPKSLQDNGP